MNRAINEAASKPREALFVAPSTISGGGCCGAAPSWLDLDRAVLAQNRRCACGAALGHMKGYRRVRGVLVIRCRACVAPPPSAKVGQP